MAAGVECYSLLAVAVVADVAAAVGAAILYHKLTAVVEYDGVVAVVVAAAVGVAVLYHKLSDVVEFYVPVAAAGALAGQNLAA